MEQKLSIFLRALLRKHRALLKSLPASHSFVQWLFHSNSKRCLSTVREVVSLLSNAKALYEEWFSIEKVVSEAEKDYIFCRDDLTNSYFCVEFSTDIKVFACLKREKVSYIPELARKRIGEFLLYSTQDFGSMIKNVRSYEELLDIVYEDPSKSSPDRKQLNLTAKQGGWSPLAWWWAKDVPQAEFRGQNDLYYLNRRICNPVLFSFFCGDLSLLPSAYRSEEFSGSNGRSIRSTFKAEPMVNLGECIEIDKQATLDLVNEDIDEEVRVELPEKFYDEIANNVLSSTSAHTMSDAAYEVDDIYDAEVDEYVEKNYDDAVDEKNAEERLAFELADETSLLTLLSQQYLNRSSCIDITTNFKAAMFFAGSDRTFSISTRDHCYVIVFMIEGYNRYCWDKSHIASCTSVEPLRLRGQSARMIFVDETAPNAAVNGILKILKIPRTVYLDFLNHMQASVFDEDLSSESQQSDKTKRFTSHSIRTPLPRPIGDGSAERMREIEVAQASIRSIVFPLPESDAFFKILLRKKREKNDENYSHVYEIDDSASS